MAIEPTEDANKAINLHHPTEKDLKQFKRGRTNNPITFKDMKGVPFRAILEGSLIPYGDTFALIIDFVAHIEPLTWITTPQVQPHSYIMINQQEVTLLK